jgi:hypothetical protein
MRAGISLHPVPLYNPQHRQALVAVGMHFPSPAQYLPRHCIFLAWIKGGNPASRSIKSVTGLENLLSGEPGNCRKNMRFLFSFNAFSRCCHLRWRRLDWSVATNFWKKFTACGWTIRGWNPDCGRYFPSPKRLYRIRRPPWPCVQLVSGYFPGGRVARTWRRPLIFIWG